MPAPRLPVRNRQGGLATDRPACGRLAAAVLSSEGLADYRTSLVLVDNAEILEINRRFLEHDYVTDVIAFPLDDDPDDRSCHGEVVVSAEKALEEARTRGEPPQRELYRYVVHGLLHLAGWDDLAPADRKAMWTRQEDLLQEFCPDLK